VSGLRTPSGARPSERTRAARDPWLLRHPDPEAKALLFMLPYLGTGASIYHRWPRHAGDVELCPVQLPGRESRLREPIVPTYEELAERLAPALARHVDGRPFGLFGHCASAYVAAEASARLVALGLPSHTLFLSSMVPPDEATSPVVTLLRLSDAEIPAFIAGMMRARGAEPSRELVELALDVMLGDLAVYRAYASHAAPVLDCPIVAIGWSDDANVPCGAVAGWERYGECETLVLPGDHWSFLGPTPELLDVIERRLVPARENRLAQRLVPAGPGR
jgi:surfactin synthase thioesterase subunit